MDADVSIEYAPLATAPFVVNEVEPIAAPIAAALVVDLGIWDVPSGKMGFTGAVRGWTARWDRTLDLDVRVWNAEIDLFVRAPLSDGFVSSWAGAGVGLRLGLLDTVWWDDVVTAGVGGWGGFGVVLGDGPVRGTLSWRASLSLDLDRWDGTVAASNETTTWSYWPGSARASVLAGVAFR